MQASSGGLSNRALVNMPTKDFAPRLGFSYGWNDKTVLRGGYGINYIQFNREGGENLLAYNGPYIVNSAITQTIATTSAASPQTRLSADQCADDLLLQPDHAGLQRKLRQPLRDSARSGPDPLHSQEHCTGYVQAWHFGLQRKLSEGTLIDLSYVGEHG